MGNGDGCSVSFESQAAMCAGIIRVFAADAAVAADVAAVVVLLFVMSGQTQETRLMPPILA